MRIFFLSLLFFSSLSAQQNFEIQNISNEDQVKLFNRIRLISEKHFDTLAVRILEVHNDSGSAGFDNCEVNSNIYIAVSGYDEYPEQSLFKLSAFYSPKIVKIIEENSIPSIYLSFIDKGKFKCIRIVVTLNDIQYSYLNNKELLIVEEPSVIFFHPSDEEIADKNMTDDSGLTEVISDFNYYSKQIEPYINQRRIKSVFSSATIIAIWQKGNEPRTYFRKDFNHSFGYILTTHKSKPHILKGVFTDIELKQEIDKYFKIGK